jgi:RIO kinase 1
MPRYNREEWKTYKNVFDSFTEKTLLKFQGQGHYDALASPITLGKEANVFTATKGDDIVIVKIYRFMNCNFNKMFEYLSQDERYLEIKNHKRKVILAWVQREYSNLLIAREYIPVPTPHTVFNNVIVMDLIGDDGQPAPMLKDRPPKDPQAFYDECVMYLERLKEGGLVHGDISAFNILNHNEHPVFIDFSQATTVKGARAKELYERDMLQLKTWFDKLQVKNAR